MTSRRTTLTVVGGALLVTYFAAANMPSQDETPRERARPAATAGAESLAEEVRSQAVRLQARMAQAPAPENNPRNPFAFGMAPRPLQVAPRVRAAIVEEAPAPMAPPPALTLMGIAEEAVTGGFRRTAVIGGEADAIYIVEEGQLVSDRYKVTKIGADAIELEDLVTKAYRRLALR